MCSICAVSYSTPSVQVLDDLFEMIHSGENRGRESAGASIHAEKLISRKKMFDRGGINTLISSVRKCVNGTLPSAGVGQDRYSTSGMSDLNHAQPFTIPYTKSGGARGRFVINHNGTVPNAQELVKEFSLDVKTHSDTEAIAKLIARSPDIETGIEKMSHHALGGRNLTIMDDEGTVYVFKSADGLSPLSYQNDELDDTRRFVASSETSALYAIRRFNPIEMKPGELIVVKSGEMEKKQLTPSCETACPFEPVYFMKPSSLFQGRDVQQIRRQIGRTLGEREHVHGENVVVSPLLESGRDMAVGFAEASSLPYVECTYKNRGDRVYMLPSDARSSHAQSKEHLARLKHPAVPHRARNKKVILVDDSSVGSQTARAAVGNLRRSGAIEVHARLGFPPITHGCMYKMDHSRRSKLVAAEPFDRGLPIEPHVARMIGADSVSYITWEELGPIVGDRGNMCTGCFSGKYPTRVPDEARSAIERVA